MTLYLLFIDKTKILTVYNVLLLYPIDIKKIKKYLQWKPKISIKKGINILLQNIDYWKSAPLWTPKNIKVATKDWFKYLK